VKSFHFRLEKVLAWRRTQLELEQYNMTRMANAMEAIDRERAQAALARVTAEMELRAGGRIDGSQLGFHSCFLSHVASLERTLAIRREEQRRLMDAQQRRLMEARLKVRLLERLKERRRAEWEAAAAREMENFAAEAHLARWNAERG
jgi:flagellar biosynthesis chaperone FliJ